MLINALITFIRSLISELISYILNISFPFGLLRASLEFIKALFSITRVMLIKQCGPHKQETRKIEQKKKLSIVTKIIGVTLLSPIIIIIVILLILFSCCILPFLIL